MKKKKIMILASLLTIFLISIASLFIKGQEPEIGNIEKVKLGTIKKTIEETGTVFSKRINTFYSDMSQKVEVLNFSVGDKVKKGDVILTYENNYDLEIEKANKQIEALTASYNEVSKGADFQEISNEKLTISTIENNLELAKSNFTKLKSLYENNAISEVEYKEAENNVTILENQLQEAKNNYEKLLNGVSTNIKNQYESQIEEIMVQIKILEKNREQSSIIAEFDGVITELSVHKGGMTKMGVPIVEIQDENNLGVYVELLADEANEVKVEMPLILMKENSKEEIASLRVDRIHPKAISKISDLGVEQKRIRIEADLEDDVNYKIGTELDAVIVLEEKENVLLVDKDAIYHMSGKEYVTVQNGDNIEEREITTGIEDDEFVEVLFGLEENDSVIIEK